MLRCGIDAGRGALMRKSSFGSAGNSMRNPFKAMFRAVKLAKKGRPISAALVLQNLLQAPRHKPKRKRSKPAVKRKKPAASRLQRPQPGTFVSGEFKSAHGALSYKFYTPTGSARRRMPLIVMLHG